MKPLLAEIVMLQEDSSSLFTAIPALLLTLHQRFTVETREIKHASHSNKTKNPYEERLLLNFLKELDPHKASFVFQDFKLGGNLPFKPESFRFTDIFFAKFTYVSSQNVLKV